MPLEITENGYHAIPPGKVAGVVTFLEIHERPQPRDVAAPDGCRLERVETPEVAWYRALHLKVGREWLWYSRQVMSDEALAEIIRHPDVEVNALLRNGEALGILELDRRVPGEVELAYFGLAADLTGTIAGRWLMERALDRAFADGPTRFWLHTDTRDHPRALAFYRRTGFTPYKVMVEVEDDPRLSGKLPMDAGPHIPIIR